MLLDDYLDELKSSLGSFASFLVNDSLTVDKRPQQQAYVFCMLIFTDASELHFREFIDASDGVIEKVAYSYHFQDKSSQLLFRFDNARHKPALGFEEHKHCANNSIIHAPAPHLQQVIEEIIMQKLI
jgi:hypothetical protein